MSMKSSKSRCETFSNKLHKFKSPMLRLTLAYNTPGKRDLAISYLNGKVFKDELPRSRVVSAIEPIEEAKSALANLMGIDSFLHSTDVDQALADFILLLGSPENCRIALHTLSLFGEPDEDVLSGARVDPVTLSLMMSIVDSIVLIQDALDTDTEISIMAARQK